MIRASMVLGVARAEARLTRRLVRYWLFVGLSLLFGALNYLNLYVIHYFFSANSASAAALNPRFFISGFATNFLLIFLVGLVFLGFDVRARDTRERMSEVLDSLPCTNVELLLGRYIGILIPAWVPFVVIGLILLGVSHILKSPVQLRSLISIFIFMALPAYMFTLGIVFFVSLLVRHRLLAAVISLGVVIGGFIATLWFIPLYAAPVVDVTGGYSLPFPSDLIGRLIDLDGVMQRLGYAMAGIAMLLFAAAVHPRPDQGSRAARAGAGAIALVLAVALIGATVARANGVLAQIDRWKRAHQSRSGQPVPDMLALSGDVRIDPGRNLSADLRLRFLAPEPDGLDSALFSLNPGFVVRSTEDGLGQALEFTQQDGLLDVRLPNRLAPGQEATIALRFEGEPLRDYAYLDAVLHPWELEPTDAQIVILGYEPRIWEPELVVLLPGIDWLPASGPDVGGEGAEAPPPDYYGLDLTVELPEGWLAAGPGRRRPGEADAGRVRYRYAPPAPVPGAALIAGPLESRGAEVDGVQFEVLVHPSHAANVEFFEDAASDVRDWLSKRLTEADELGLPYPYDGLTLVEVPMVLRGYGGGWRMDTTMIQPGTILVRESSFPTARFDRPFRDPDAFRDQEGGVPAAKVRTLERFFENDLNGGNPFVAAARDFFAFQTSAEGAAEVPLDYVCETMATRLLTDKQSYFSVHIFDSQVGQTFQRAGFQMNDPDRISDNFAEVMIQMLTSTPRVWDTILETSLVELDPWEDPERAIDVLSLKGGAMAQSLLDGLGREKSGALLSRLRDEHSGEHFTRADVVGVGEEIDTDMSQWLDVWLDETDLPGFTVGDVKVDRITDADDGAPRYQVLATLRNEEGTPGLIRVDYRAGDRQSGVESDRTDPIRVEGNSALEIGVVTSKPPRLVRVIPYLALNRDPFALTLPPVDEERVVDAEPFTGTREIDWQPPADERIVVDDLDPGFSIVESEKGSWLRFAGSNEDVETDQGLPVAETPWIPPSRWSRNTTATAYGKYRHTMAFVRAGSGERKAIFSAEIPRAGEWELEYHLPRLRSRRRGEGASETGTWRLTVIDTSGSRDVAFDIGTSELGWNSLGTFEIADGEVRVEISDETDARSVVADAIRWVPVSAAEVAEVR